MNLNAATSHPELLRLFISLDVPDEVKARFELAQDSLRSILRASDVSWGKPEQFHLTLRFLGNVHSALMQELARALEESCRDFGTMGLRAEGLGCFPNEVRPRVVWVGIAEPTGALGRLHSAIQSAMAELPVKPQNNSFHAHVTLARVKQLACEEARTFAHFISEMKEKLFGEWIVHALNLMRSELSPQGARHTRMLAVPLVS